MGHGAGGLFRRRRCWNYFPHDHARSRAYRWGEDGLLGITRSRMPALLCAGAVEWAAIPILKERLFGLTNPEGNHGEDVKEFYFYLDSTPTHSYMKALYKYPQAEFPYARLVEENAGAASGAEFELLDTGIFDENRYFDVFAEYAKAAPDDILIRLTRRQSRAGSGAAACAAHALVSQYLGLGLHARGLLAQAAHLQLDEDNRARCEHETLGRYIFELAPIRTAAPPLLFTENETNHARLFGAPNESPYVKDAFHEYVDSRATRRR